MASAVHSIEKQEDFSGGAVTSVAPHLVPTNGVLRIRNGFIGDQEDGSIYKRGGAEYLSGAAFGTRISFLWDGLLVGGRRTVFANPADFGVLDTNGSTVVNLGGDGLPYPRPAAHVGGLLFIGGGYIYGGSRKTAPYSTGTVTLTNGSKTVTGSGTTWASLVDAGMLLQRGNERVYGVETINSTTQLTLSEPYEGVTGAALAYSLNPLYTITTADPYEDSDIYAVAQNRLLWAQGRFLRFAPLQGGFPANHSAWLATDEWELPEDILGIAEVSGTVLVFTRAGTWTLQGIGFDIVDPTGNPQHRLVKLSDHVLLEGAGLAYWEQGLVAPFTDGIYILDGISAPTRLSNNISDDYHLHVRRGYRAGQAAVFNSHYFLPLLDDGGVVYRLYSGKLDRRAFDGRRRLTFPWSWHDGTGAQVAALTAALADDRHPRLLAGQSIAAARVLDCSPFFRPDDSHKADPDGTAPDCDVITRDFATGSDTDNRVRFIRTRYELSDAATDNPVVRFSWSDGSLDAGVPMWDQVDWDEFDWASDESASFTSLACDGPESDGRDTHRCRVGKRRRFIRFRIQQEGACGKFVLRSVEVFVKPSNAVRR